MDEDPMNPLNEASRGTDRYKKQLKRDRYQALCSDAPGDGTAPERSGHAPTRYSQSVLTVGTEHESAFNHEAARHFTASAIVKIAQAVKTTSLAYKS